MGDFLNAQIGSLMVSLVFWSCSHKPANVLTRTEKQAWPGGLVKAAPSCARIPPIP